MEINRPWNEFCRGSSCRLDHVAIGHSRKSENKDGTAV